MSIPNDFIDPHVARSTIKVERADRTTLLYSHDDGFTRYAIDIKDGRYSCLLNESPCFRRGTHDHMARAHGINLCQLEGFRRE